MDEWQGWIGRTCEADDLVTAGMVEGLCATLDREPNAGEPAPQGIHWLLAPTRAPMHALGPDGHPERGGFLPPIDLPHRMWAASDIRFLRPLAIGDAIRLRSEIRSIAPKTGASGPLVFVEVLHTTTGGGVTAVEEKQTVVYRGVSTAPPRTESDHGPADFERRCRPDPVMLFRYSALTFNSHRIHYDQPYATAVEGYPALVVHGPLTATLLLDLCAERYGGNRLASFSFRAVSPAFCGDELVIRGRKQADGIELIAISAGRVTMRGKAKLA